MIAGPQHGGDLPAPELGRPGVLRVLEEPGRERSRRPPSPRCRARRARAGPPPRPPPAPPTPRPRARSRPPRARRRPGGRPPAGRPPRSARRAARSPPEGPSARAASSPATAWSKRRPLGASRKSGRGRSGTASTLRNKRLGHEHHAGAAAERAIVDRATRVVGALAQVVHPHVERPRLDRPPEDRGAAVAGDDIGEDREDVDPHKCLTSASQVQQPLGDVDVDRPRRRVMPVTKCSGINAPDSSSTRRSLAGFASTAATRPSSTAIHVAHDGADELVHPQRPGLIQRLG